MSRRFLLGYVLITAPDRKHVWGGPGLLPLARPLPKVPPLWEDRLDALRAADALRRVLGIVLRPERVWAP